MAIVRVTCFRQDQPFRDGPYVVSGGRVSEGFDSLIVRLTDESGTQGWGEMSPLGTTYDPAFAAGARAAAAELAPVLLGEGADQPVALTRLLDQALKGHPYAKAAFDMAAWDLAARRAGVALCDLLGGRYGEGTRLYRSLSKEAPEAMATRAQKYWAEGYRRLQVKIGGDAFEDEASLRAVASALPPDAVLFCDANGGYAPAEARRFLALTRELNFVLEQPCATLRECLLLRAAAERPLVLDESIVDLESLCQAALAGVDGVTLKIARIGGVTRTRLLRDVAVELGLMVTVEDTGGADIDTAAMAHLSLSTPEARRQHTVDFHNWVTASNGRGLPPTSGGLLRVPEGPGLGLVVAVAALGEPFLDLG
jgi:L-alanine-DL-glutamate epimerase-like enolase superfamily enzyme